MPIPRIAIVGRPNTGKSSLLNMIAGSKVSIVDPTPGVTRDRVATIVDLQAPEGHGPVKPAEFIDTGGFGAYVADGARYDDVGKDLATLAPDIESQIASAISGADLVLFAVDAQAGIMPLDQEIARRLREGKLGRGKNTKTRVPVRVVATKVDGPKWESHAMELAGLGFDEPLMCSAKNNYFRRDFLDAIYEALPKPGKDAAEAHAQAEMMLAIIGKRNAGKSTLVNTLAGEERMIVSEIAGTTRDAVDVRFDMEIEGRQRSLVAIDTAGLRRKKSFASMVEEYAFDRAKRAVARADVVVLVLDATEKISQVDEQLAMMAQKTFKPVLLAVNKWDAVEGVVGRKGTPVTTEDYEEYLRKELKGLDFAPISFISGADGSNVRETVEVCFELLDQSRTRITTGKLNRIMREIMDQHPPSSKQGHAPKLFYVAQTGTNPPTISLVVNDPSMFTVGYQRYVINQFRERLPFGEVPMRLNIRDRKRALAEGKPTSQEEETASGAPRPRAKLDRTARGAEVNVKLDFENEAAAYFEDD